MDRTARCLSSYAIEKAAGGKGWATPLSQEQLAHLEICPLCAERVRQTRAAEAEFRSIVLPDGSALLADRLRHRRSERFLAWGLSGAVAAAAVLVAVLVLPQGGGSEGTRSNTGGRETGIPAVQPHGGGSEGTRGNTGGRETGIPAVQPRGAAGDSEKPSGMPGPDSGRLEGAGRQAMPVAERSYTGLKAASSLILYVKRGQDVFRHEPGTPLRPGDELRVVPVAPERSCILLLLRDAAGDVQIVYPWNGKASGPLPEAGQPVAGAFELDERIGTEEWVAVFSDVPIEAAALVGKVSGSSVEKAGRRVVAGVPVEVVVARYEKVGP